MAPIIIMILLLLVPARLVFAQNLLFGVDVSSVSCGPSTLITIDPATGAGTAVGPITGFPCVTGLAFAPDGTLYGVSTADFGGTGDLIKIDPATGEAIAVGPLGFTGVDALAVAPDGTIFAAVQPGAPTSGGPFLAMLDPNTGAGTQIGPFGPGICVEGLSFAPDGTLFGAADISGACAAAQTLITVNTSTGAGTIIGPIGFPDVDAISFTSEGTLFGANLGSGTLFTINTTTGAGTAIGPIGFCCIVGLASPVPKVVPIDIKPSSFPNSINPMSKGTIPVAILTSGAIDATTVDETTVLFGATGTEAGPVQSVLEDVDGDGDTDVILYFNTRDTGIQCGDTSATLTGETFGGQKIEGSDSIKTVGCK